MGSVKKVTKRLIPSDRIFLVDAQKFKEKVRKKPIMLDQLVRLKKKLLLSQVRPNNHAKTSLYRYEINRLLLLEGVIDASNSESRLISSKAPFLIPTSMEI